MGKAYETWHVHANVLFTGSQNIETQGQIEYQFVVTRGEGENRPDANVWLINFQLKYSQITSLIIEID